MTCLQRSTENILVGNKIICKRACAHTCSMDAGAISTSKCMCIRNIELQQQLKTTVCWLSTFMHCFQKPFQASENAWIHRSFKTQTTFFLQWETVVCLSLLCLLTNSRKESQGESCPSFMAMKTSPMLWPTLIFPIFHIFGYLMIYSFSWTLPLMCMTFL